MFQALFRLSDTAMNVLFTFFAMFFATLVEHVPSLPQSFVSNLPKTKRAACSVVISSQSLKKFVCCASCHAIYHWEECIVQNEDGQKESKLCTFKEFPDHPQSQHRNQCGHALMKAVKSSQGQLKLYPQLIYCYCSVIESLRGMIRKTDFIEKCEHWRERMTTDGKYYDVYDGKVWKDFMTVNDVPFLSAPYNFAFQLNVDWFQPFKHTQHSEGAIYLSILNLPREERFLKENVILVGIIPGPKEPAIDMNSFLQPLVDELKELWEGVIVSIPNKISTIIRAALICVACDIPAARKVCVFLGHRATMGCSKCLLRFPTEAFGDKPDYSNFDRSQWTPRTNSHHRSEATNYCACNTRSERVGIQRRSGVRYSCLLQLAYFDASRMCIIDPMHNLLLGTSKKVIDLWKTKNVLTEKHLVEIQKRVDTFTCPSDVGRLPLKISSHFSGFTAEQWKNWTIYFSLYALKGILPWNHYNCWLLFVKSCWIFCRRSISVSELVEGDKNIMEFCDAYKTILGANMCTMNLHLHGHLRQCIEDYGPVYSFWCFSYERLNGILGSYPTNSHHISVQLARRFLESKVFAHGNWPAEYVEEYLPLLQHFNYNKGSLIQTNLENNICPLPPIKKSVLFCQWN